MAAQAAVGDTNLVVVTQQATGTAAWDALDANATNDVIRTNDTITYTVSVRNEPAIIGGGQATTPTVTFTLPKGQEITSLPTDCLSPGSSITPAALGTLPTPLTNLSWNAFAQQTVVCRVANRPTGSNTIDYLFVSKVRSEVPDGTVMSQFTATAASTEMPAGATSTALPAVEVAAEPIYDLSKNGMNVNNTQSGFVDIDTVACTNPAYALAGLTGCQTLRYPILLSVQANGKGTTPLSSPITFNDDLTPEAFFGSAQFSSPGWNPDFAPSIVGCGSVTGLNDGSSFFPLGAGSGTNAVTNSGTISCVPNGQGVTPITITGADTTANHYPTVNGTFNVTVPVNRAYIVSGWVKVEFPVAAISAIGALNGVSNAYQISYRNEFTDLAATDIAGNPLVSEPNTLNNYRAGNTEIVFGGGFGKTFTGEPGNPTNSGGNGYSAGQWAGSVGSGNGRDGAGIVQAGSKITSLIMRSTVSPPGYGPGIAVICDAWDNTKAALTEDQWRALQAGTTSAAAPFGTVGYVQQFPSNGKAIWLSSGDIGANDFTVEYRAGTGNRTVANDCLNETTGWETDPADVVGNDPTLEAQNIFTGVGAVRIVFASPGVTSQRNVTTANFSIGLTVLDTVATNDIIGNWASSKLELSSTNTAPDLADTIAANGTLRYPSTYVASNHGGLLGDRVTVQTAVARIVKQVRNPDTGLFTGASTPVYETGDNITYRISPSITAGVTTGATTDVYVEDCLPARQSFVSSQFQGGASVTPDINQLGAPVGATLACAADRVYLRWNYGLVVVNSPLTPILYDVTLDPFAPGGTYINDARVTAGGDASATNVRTDTAEIQVDDSPGIRLAKTAIESAVEVNPAGATTPRTVGWEVVFAAVDSDNISNPDIIDTLPVDGLNGNNFEGDLNLQSVTATATTGTPTILYTARATTSINGDPKHASNLAGGATVWCDAPVGGAIVSGVGAACPTGLDTVTGVRTRQTGAVASGYTLTVTVRMTPVDNADGDLYNNVAEANADGVLQGVGPVNDVINVFASSVGDFVWVDADKNGIQDGTMEAVAGVPVRLAGVDADGNIVTGSTTTNASGRYLFDSIPSGTYTVEFDKLWLDAHDYELTLLTTGADIDLDSDAILATGFTAPFVLGLDEDRLDLDAGVIPIPPLITRLAITGATVGGPVLVAWLLGVAGFLLFIMSRRRKLAAL